MPCGWQVQRLVLDGGRSVGCGATPYNNATGRRRALAIRMRPLRRRRARSNRVPLPPLPVLPVVKAFFSNRK